MKSSKPAKRITEATTTQIAIRATSGPLPAPELLARYQELGYGELIVRLAEDANRRENLAIEANAEAVRSHARVELSAQEQENRNQQTVNRLAVVGAWVLPCLFLAVMGSSVFLLCYAQAWPGQTLGGIGFFGCIAELARHYAPNRKSRDK